MFTVFFIFTVVVVVVLGGSSKKLDKRVLNRSAFKRTTARNEIPRLYLLCLLFARVPTTFRCARQINKRSNSD